MTQETSASQGNATQTQNKKTVSTKPTVSKKEEKTLPAGIHSGNGMDLDRYMDDMLAGWRGMMNSFFDPAKSAGLAVNSPIDPEAWRAQADRYFADMQRRWVGFSRMPLSMFGPLTGVSLPPLFELKQEDNGYVVSGAVPGMDADDISLELDGHMLSISGEKSESDEKDRNGVQVHSECTGSFSQKIHLPLDAVVDKLEAKVEKGVLTVSVPKAAEFKPKPRKVKVNG